jgi:SAM-dependent methyltransferase
VLLSAENGLTTIESDLESLKLPSESIQCVGLFDVIEHVENRTFLLTEVFRCLHKDGKLVITVPAFKWLWSVADNDVGHHLRYSRGTLKRELRKNGFDVQSSKYMFFSLVFPILLLRAIPFRIGIRQPVKDTVLLRQVSGRFGKILGRIESEISRITPIGSSLLVVATKRSE